MKTKIVILLSIISCFFSSPVFGDYAVMPKSGNELKVAVYDNGVETKDFAINYIYDAMKAAAGVKTELIDNLAADTLKKYDAVIIASVTKLAKKDISDSDRNIKGSDWIRTLTNFVDGGGGLIFCHNAVGFRGIFASYKLFPMIGFSNSKNMASTDFAVSNCDHPIMADIGKKFVHGYDHMEIHPGKNAQVLATDSTGKAVIVAGDVSRGRVVQIGFPPGIYWKDITGNGTNMAALNKTDTTILINAVKWAGAKPKYEISMQETEAGLLKETMSLKKQQENELLAKYKYLSIPKFDEAIIWMPLRWMGPGAIIDSRDKVVNILNNCKRMGFNKVAIIMKHGPVCYPSKLKLDATNDNGLYYGDCAIQEAKKRGIKVALVISPFINGPSDGKDYPVDVNKTEYDKIQQGKMVSSDIGKATSWCIKNCPDYPGVRQRALDVTAELIEKYQPDEIYLDYIRYKDGYETSCYCDYSQKKKAEFAKQHPDVAKNKLDSAFAESSITSFVKEWNALCKKLYPKIKTSCYTMSTARNNTPATWVNNYPLDWHSKYVSRHTSGPESSLDDTAALVSSYSKWMKSGVAGSQFSPMIAAYDPKSSERLLTEFKIVSDFQNKADVKFKRVEFYEYGQLLEGPKKDLKISNDMARGISQALGGSWDTQQP